MNEVTKFGYSKNITRNSSITRDLLIGLSAKDTAEKYYLSPVSVCLIAEKLCRIANRPFYYELKSEFKKERALGLNALRKNKDQFLPYLP